MSQAPATKDCKQPGLVVPVIDRRRCEGKEDCLRVCPYQVFTIGVLDAQQRAALPLFPARFKAWVHGYKQAFVQAPEACHACAACVTACPEKAITLQPVKQGS